METNCSTSLKTADCSQAIQCLQQFFPSVDRRISDPHGISADLIYELATDQGVLVEWEWIADSIMMSLNDLEIFKLTCRIDVGREDAIYVVNDFTYCVENRPFVTQGADLHNWVLSYIDNVVPRTWLFHGDLIVWGNPGVYVMSHERVFFSIAFQGELLAQVKSR